MLDFIFTKKPAVFYNQNRILYTVVLISLLFFNSFSWGQTTITIDLDSTGITSTGYDNGAERIWTQGGIDFGGKAVLKGTGGNANTIQCQASNGVIYNTTAIPGVIKEIKITQNNSNTFTLYGGTSSRLVNSTSGNYTVTGGTSEGTTSGITWTSADLTSKGYTFFAIKKGSGASYVSSIEITYVPVLSAPDLSNESYTGTVGTPFSETPSNTGGVVDTWGIISGSLPTGLSLNASTGEISGTPTTNGFYLVDIEATNTAGSSIATYDFTINTAPISSSCFNDDFSDITSGNNTSTGGSGTTWSGNTNFPTVVNAFQAGGAVRLGTGSAIGSIESIVLSSISGNMNVKIKVKGWTNVEGDIKVSINGQSQTLSYSAKIADPFELITCSFTGVTTGAKLKIETTAKRAFIDDIEIVCNAIPACVPDVSVTEIRPNKAPVHSKVQVEVNDASLITQVNFEGNPITYSVINSTTIELDIPSSASVGMDTITLVEALCETKIPFEVLELIGTCNEIPASYSDLFISEIYDSEAANEWYMELYNPTVSPITLDGVYSIERRGTIGGAVDRTINLTGTVAPFSTFTMFLGNSPTYSSGSYTCSGVTFDFISEGTGINADDEIDLVKNGNKVDEARAPSDNGYTLIRKVIYGETVPTTSYSASQWDINSNESCSDLGNLIIDELIIDLTSPSDITACKVDLSVSSLTLGVTYKWYYNDANTMTTWKEVNTTNLPGLTISGQTSDNLIISGNTISLDGYQFYCEVMDGSCGRISNTSIFKYENYMVYRSANSGDWTTISNWEVANSIAGPWTSACTYPNATNSDSVYIESGHSIVLDIDNDIDYLVIKDGATLETAPNSKLTINNQQVGADFIVNGTYLYRGDASNSLVLNSNASWSLGMNATVIKTNSGGVAVLRDNYEGGIATIPATAQWIYRYNGDGDPMAVSVNMYYPNLRFENTTVTPYTTNSNSAFTGNSGITTIKGNLEIGTTGSSTYALKNNNYNSSPMLIMGDLMIGNGSELINTALSSDAGTGVEIQGNMTIDGLLNLTSGSTERIIKFSGSNNQSVSGAGTINAYKIEVNKPTGDLNLNRNLQAQNELKMVNGNIYTNSNQLELGLNTSQKGTLTYTDGFVIGKMKRWFNGINSGEATSLFPMGWNDSGLKDRFASIEFTIAPTSGGSLTTEFIPQPMALNGIPIAIAGSGGFGSSIMNTEDQGYWTISADGIAGGIYNANLTGEGFEEIVDLADITMLKRPTSSDPWSAIGTHISATGSTAVPTVHRTGLSGFSDFGFGSRNEEHPLPIELLSFDVNCVKGQTILNWKTATEHNNDKFILETSTDMQEWNVISEIRGAGNSQQINEYSFSYHNANEVITYYRLSQVDFDGQSEIFNPISSLCKNDESEIIIYPIPASKQITILFDGYDLNNAQLSITDIDGKQIKQVQMEASNQNTITIDVSSLSKGIYFIQLQTVDGVVLKKIEID